MVNIPVYSYATRPFQLRNAIGAHREWIEAQLGCSLADVVIVETSVDLAQISIERILGQSEDRADVSRSIRRLRSLVASAEIPPGVPPLIGVSRAAPKVDFFAALQETTRDQRSKLDWQDCPVSMIFHSVAAPVVALNVFYQAGPGADCESMTSVLIVRKECTKETIRLLEALDCRESLPQLYTHHGRARAIARCDWDDLVLDRSIVSLLKNDFESFWKREQWFHDRHLPFRRGYLLHGPPGNGKSTAIRAMMCSRGLSAFTIRLFDPQTSDADLDELFEEALTERPAIIVLEDLDRAFPRTGETKTQVSVQNLLNCLDGVASGEGTITIATANEPTALDPAILRRPGRFDRVVHFPNPSREMRLRYFLHMNPHHAPAAIQQTIADSSGLSFAQLREAAVLASQFAFERNDDVTAIDLLRGVHTLRETIVHSPTHSNSAGFTSVPQDGLARIEKGATNEP
jgi:hypothetical protein